MSNKSEKTLGWGEATAILVTLCLVLAPGVNFAESHLVRLFSEKLFDIALALVGTLFGYWLAKRHIEHLMAAIVKTLDTKCFNLFRERAFHRAVSEMLTELPDFSVRPTKAFSSHVADSIREFTHWPVGLYPPHTPEKSNRVNRKRGVYTRRRVDRKRLGIQRSSLNSELRMDD